NGNSDHQRSQLIRNFSLCPFFHPLACGSDHSHRRSQAGKDHGQGQHNASPCACQPSHQVSKEISGVHICRIVISSLGTQIGQAAVYNKQKKKSDHNNPKHHIPVFFFFRIALLLKSHDKNSCTDNSCPYIARIISGKESTEKSLLSACLCSSLDRSQRMKNSQKDHCQKGNEEDWGQILSDPVNDIGLVHGKIVG